MQLKQVAWLPNIFLVLSLFIIQITCLKPDDPWTSVETMTQYKDLPSCAQNCLLNVTSVTNCTAYSCVCSESSNGDNFLMGYTFITNCTTEGCQDRNITDKALLSFNEVCKPAHSTTTTSFVATTPGPTPVVNHIPPESTSTHPPPSKTTISHSPTLQIKPRSYTHLPPCSKFTLNSCRHEADNSDCGPTKRPLQWETYPGLATTLRCSTPECLCSSSAAFSKAYNALYNQSVFFCNYLPSVTDRISDEYDALQGALADFCDENGFRETITGSGYRLVVNGTAQGGAVVEGCNLKDGDDKIKTPDIITMALGIPALIASITTLYLQMRQMKLAAASHANHNNAALHGLDGTHPDGPDINNVENNIALGSTNNRRDEIPDARKQQQQRQRDISEGARPTTRRGPRTGPRTRSATTATNRLSSRELLQPSSPDTETEEADRFNTEVDSEGVSANERGFMLRNIGRGSGSGSGSRYSRGALMMLPGAGAGPAPGQRRRSGVSEEKEEEEEEKEERESAAEDGDADAETEAEDITR